MPKIYIVGVGVGHPDYLTEAARKVIQRCDKVLGAKRLLESIKHLTEYGVDCSINQVLSSIQQDTQAKEIAIVVSGDVGFYSLAKNIREQLDGVYECIQIPGISSMQYFLSQLGMSYEQLCTVSMHGREGNVLGKLRLYPRVFVLTGGVYSVQTICELLDANGFGETTLYVGECLSYENEKITKGTPKTLKKSDFAPLSVMLIEQEAFQEESYPLPGLPDQAFLRNKAPMTKSEIRALALSKLQVGKKAIVYDIGAGTGSVSVEIARQAPEGKVYALEKNEEAVELIRANKDHFKLHNIEVIHATCPDGLEMLEAPDAVFIGGSSGQLDFIIETVLNKNSHVRIVINAITLETLAESMKCFEKYKLVEQDMIQVTVASSKTLGRYHMMMGQNPIFILSGRGADGSVSS